MRRGEPIGTRCVACAKRGLHRSAAYDAPGAWCAKHWGRWWASMGRTRRERHMVYNEAMAVERENK